MAAAWGGTVAAIEGANHFTVLAPFADPASDVVARAESLARG
jgi:hypothetical protein